MPYQINEEPINLQTIAAIIRDVEQSPKAWHHAVKEKPDQWGFDIIMAAYGSSVAINLTMRWDLPCRRTRYVALKHFHRILDLFSKDLSNAEFVLSYDPFDLQISLEDNAVYIKQSLTVITVERYLYLSTLENARLRQR